jgi:hypothetical protein
MALAPTRRSRAGVGARGLALAIASFAALATAGSAAQEGQGDDARHGRNGLHGPYGFSLSQSCVRTPFQAPPAAGFDPASKQLLVNGEFVSGFGTGVLRFRDGVATLEDGLITEISAGQVAASQTPVSPGTRFECVGPYRLLGGSRVAITLSCEAATPQPGLRVLIEPVRFEGYVGSGHSLTLNTTQRELHTVTVYNGQTPLQQRQRVCLQSLALNKL